MKKTLCILLSVLMLVGVFTALPLTASAAPAGETVGDVASNVTTLKNYIKNNGDYDGVDYYFTDQIDDGAGYYYFITFTLLKSGALEFSTARAYDEDDTATVQFNPPSSTSVKATVERSSGNTDYFKGQISTTLSAYNPTSQLAVSVLQTNGSYSSSAIATNTRNAVANAMARFQTVLNNRLGMGLGDLGFGYYPAKINVPVTGIKLNTSTLSITAGTTYTFKVTITPSDATNKTVYWSSSDPAIAGMGSGNVITAKKPGTCTVTAKTNNGKTASCKVTVKAKASSNVPVTGIKLNTTSVTMSEGTSYTLKATISPSNATNKTVLWSSSNTAVAGMKSGGVINAKKPGTCTITAKTNNGKTATCKVTVTPAPTSVKLNYSALTMTEGTKFTLKATVSPSNAGNKTVTWSSSNKNVAVVTNKGVVTARTIGSAVITAKTFNGKTASCKITVKAKKGSSTVACTGIKLNYSSLTMTEGTTFTLKATITPSNATNKTVYWSSSDPTIAGMGNGGVVNAKKPGTITVTAKTNNGLTATCKITVRSKTQKYKDNFNKLYNYVNSNGTQSGQGKSLSGVIGRGDFMITAISYSGALCVNFTVKEGSLYYDASVTWNINTGTNGQVWVAEGDGQVADNWETTANINVTTYNGSNATFTDEYGHSYQPGKYLNYALSALDEFSQGAIKVGVKDIGFASFNV